MLSNVQQSLLLQIARDSIASHLEGRPPAADPPSYDEGLRKPAGAFVTLKTKDGDHLRGCIGSVFAVDPLWKAVSQSAINAAFRDPRFPPVRREELPTLRLEISVMGPILPVSSIDEIVVGRDGLIIRRGAAAGLLLPQVATEHNWDRETFVAHTCWKAGLPMDSWHDSDTRIERFEAFVFAE